MKPIVSIIMGSTSDLPVMEKAAEILNEFQNTLRDECLVGSQDTGRG